MGKHDLFCFIEFGPGAGSSQVIFNQVKVRLVGVVINEEGLGQGKEVLALAARLKATWSTGTGFKGKMMYTEFVRETGLRK